MKVSEEDLEAIIQEYGYKNDYWDKKNKKWVYIRGVEAAGMIELASNYGMCGHNPEIVRYTDDGKIRRLVMKSTVSFDGEKIKGDYGGHVGLSTRDVSHPQFLERVAETRAIARAIQFALGLTNKRIGIIWVEGEKDIEGNVPIKPEETKEESKEDKEEPEPQKKEEETEDADDLLEEW